jgi:hypothetical protein
MYFTRVGGGGRVWTTANTRHDLLGVVASISMDHPLASIVVGLPPSHNSMQYIYTLALRTKNATEGLVIVCLVFCEANVEQYRSW